MYRKSLDIMRSGAFEQHSATGDLLKRWSVTGREEDSTNQRAELWAAIKGLEAVSKAVGTDILVISDSSYLVDGMSHRMTGWKQKGLNKRRNADLWHRLNDLTENKAVEFQWVRGHSGNAGNDAAHALAKSTLHRLPETV